MDRAPACHTVISSNFALEKSLMQALKHNGVAFIMLAISVVALYWGILFLALVPLIWMGYRIGKEMGRQEVHNEMARDGTASVSALKGWQS